MLIASRNALLSACLAAALAWPAAVQAQEAGAANRGEGPCLMIGQMTYDTMQQYQSGHSEAQAKKALQDKYVARVEAEFKPLFAELAGQSVAVTYHSNLPKGKNKDEQEKHARQYARAAYQGCVDQHVRPK